ncbi:MAG: carbohydrate ABC transporter permease [Anaerolineaceae bacterium]|nr:carbohydrate ABC transporter permease [Anaerolineaceae bacterium]
MQRTNSAWARGAIHLVLILWVIYSVGPFIWAIIGSTQRTRDAIAREPRFVPQFILDSPLAIVLLIALLVLGAAFWIRRSAKVDEETGVVPKPLAWRWPILAIVVLAGVFLLAHGGINDRNIFSGSMNNYQELWLSEDPAGLTGIAFGLVALLIILIAVGVYARNLEKWRTQIYFAIAAIVVGVILWLPSIVQFAEFYDYFLNSVVVTVGTVLISISIGCLAGYGLARYSGIAGVVILFAALAFRALPRMAFILPYYYFAQLSGLYDTFPLLIVTFVAINQPFTIWMLRSFFMEIPRELEEAAMIDGCNRLTGFVRVIVPIVWPGIITTALFTLLLAYNEFLLARLLTATNSTLPVGISRYTSGEDARLIPLSNASAVSITLPIVFIIIFFQRYLIKGLAGGAVKG